MRMRHTALLAVAALCALAPATAAAGGQRDAQQHQSIHLDATAGDGSSDGLANITATQERGGYRIRGYVEAMKGCVSLKGVEMHLGTYLGGDTISHVCGERQEQVDAWTQHSEVVLSADVPHGFGRDSKIVTLTGHN